VPLRQAFKEYLVFGALDYVFFDVALLNRLIFACGESLLTIAREFEKTSEVSSFHVHFYHEIEGK
jgi:hypothetical protein